MTNQQKRMLGRIRNFVKAVDFYRPEDYEFKRFEVQERGAGSHPVVHVFTEVGRKHDDASEEAVYFRTKRHYMIGPTGIAQLDSDEGWVEADITSRGTEE